MLPPLRKFMNKGYCEKREGKDCSKCFRKNEYFIGEPPCKYYIYHSKGYEGTLKDINGIKMRRQWFFTPMVLSSGFILILVIVFAMSSLLCDIEWLQEDKEFVSILFTYIIFPFEFLLLMLSVISIKLCGKTVAVINDDGVHTNQAFLKWNEITEVEFSPRVLYKNRFDDCAYTTIVSKRGIYKIAHMPLYFLLEAKKYNPEISIKINKKIVRLYIILFSLSFIIPIVLHIFD